MSKSKKVILALVGFLSVSSSSVLLFNFLNQSDSNKTASNTQNTKIEETNKTEETNKQESTSSTEENKTDSSENNTDKSNSSASNENSQVVDNEKTIKNENDVTSFSNSKKSDLSKQTTTPKTITPANAEVTNTNYKTSENANNNNNEVKKQDVLPETKQETSNTQKGVNAHYRPSALVDPNSNKEFNLELIGSNIKSNLSGKIKYGEKVVITLNPKEKYYPFEFKVNDIDKLGELKNNTYEFAIKEDTQIKVQYERRSSLTLIGEGLSVEPNIIDGKLKTGALVTLSITPPEGKTLSALIVSDKNNTVNRLGSVMGNIFEFYLDRSTTITAEYQDITVNPESDFTFDPRTATITAYRWNAPKDIIIPDTINGVTVKHIDDYAFNGLGINSIKLPSALETIGEFAFDANNLKYISIPNSVKEIRTGAFKDNKLKSVILPDEVKLNVGVFLNNEIVEFKLPTNMTEIPRRLLEGNKLEKLILHDNVIKIGEKAFYKNELTNVNIPSKVVQIDALAFAKNKILKAVLPEENIKVFPNAFDFGTNVNLPKDINDMKNSPESDFEFNATEKTITAYLGNDWNIVIPETINGVKVEKIGFVEDYFDGKTGAFENKNLNKVIIPEGVKVIDENAFKSSSLKEIVLPNSLIEIKTGAFENNDLVNVELPQNITVLSERVFKDNKLQQINLQNITEIKTAALQNNNISSIKLPENLSVIENEILENNKLTSVKIPDTVQIIGEKAFAGNKITNLNIPQSVTQIKNLAFSSNGLTSLVVPENVEVIGKGAFAFNKIASLEVKGSTEILNKAFYQNEISNLVLSDDTLLKEAESFQFNRLTKVIIPKRTKEIPDLVFAANKIENIYLHNEVISIGYGAFYVNNIKELVILDNVKEIENAAFFNNRISKLKMPSNLETINEGVFRLNNLSEVDIPDSVTTIKEGAFAENKIKEVSLYAIVRNDNGFDESTEIKIKEDTQEMKDKKTFIEIEDKNLQKVINKNIDKNREGTEAISKYDIEKLTEISIFLKEDGKADFGENAQNSILETTNLKGTEDFKFAQTKGIKSIQGLENAINLEKIRLSDNEIVDLTPLSNLKKLTYLDLHRNRITNTQPLSNLTNLEFLDLYNNLIEDVTPLSTLTNLKHLDLHYNVKVDGNENNKIFSRGIRDISALSTLKNLELLSVSENQIEDISVINELPKVKTLDFVNNKVKDYTNKSEYIVNLTKKMFEEEGYSINFYGQNVDYSGEIVQVDSNEEIIKSEYVGIKELQERMGAEFGEEDFNFFANIDTGHEGISAIYDHNNNNIILNFTDEFLQNNEGQNIKLNLRLYNGEYGWKLSNINLEIQENDNLPLVSQENYDFYLSLFNKYSNFEKKYTNLTDEANQLMKTQRTKPKENGQEFTKEDFKMLKKFVVTDREITNTLTRPLKYATNLEEFKVELNDKNIKRNITNFSFLKNLAELKIFYYQNQDYVGLEKENLPQIDFTNNTKLKDIRINSTNLSNLDFISHLNLETLSLQDNSIVDISAIQNMTDLKRLDLDNNSISELGANLNNLTNLITLYLRDNPISNIEGLTNLTSLEALHLRNTNVSDINSLKQIPRLFRLYLDRETNLQENYFETIKELSNVNTLFVDEITKEEFEWLKQFSIRSVTEEATYGEDKARMYNFTKLVIPITVQRDSIIEGKILVDNPLKDWGDMYIIQSETGDDGYIKNANINFVENDSKIEISNFGDKTNFEEKYDIFIENYENTFGDYGQPASISGTVILKVTIE